MMSDLNRIINPLNHSISDLFRQTSHVAGELAGRLAKHIQQLPGKMHQDHRVAVAVFVVSNSAFFTLAHVFAKWVNHRIEKHPEELTKDQQLGKTVLLSLIVGTTVAVFNQALAKVTHTPLSKAFIAVISTTAIAAHILLNRKPTEITEKPADLALDATDKETVVEDSKTSPKKEDLTPEDSLKKLEDEHQTAMEKLKNEHQAGVGSLNVEINGLKTEKTEKEKALKEAQDQILGLTSALSELEAKVAAATKEKEVLNPLITDAQDELKLAQDEVATLQDEVAKLKTFSEKKIKDLQAANNNIEALTSEINKLTKNNKTLATENESLKLQLNAPAIQGNTQSTAGKKKKK